VSSSKSESLILQLTFPKRDKGGNPPNEHKLRFEKTLILQNMGDEMSNKWKDTNEVLV
jgi:hypothetical protein